ncbi:hypothetical protein OS493_011315 [Desmophyllum pertusum]|uniref:Uncharacterized protein n=1 Tax=Desmophyllum pertusum TaxID=174260 RepID=A0A9X0CSC3_9CNID|nr:hypothetical protein OS493_011315 [Desmophyllum pertusum]
MTEVYGLDLRRNLDAVYNETGTYGTELFTREADKVLMTTTEPNRWFLYFAQQAVHVGNGDKPLQAPKKYLDRLGYIGDEKSRTFAGIGVSSGRLGRVSTALLHASDWLPTFYSLAGGDMKGLDLLTDSISGRQFPVMPSPRGTRSYTVWIP